MRCCLSSIFEVAGVSGEGVFGAGFGGALGDGKDDAGQGPVGGGQVFGEFVGVGLFDFVVGDVEQVELLAVVVGEGKVEDFADGQPRDPALAAVLEEWDGLVEFDGGHGVGSLGVGAADELVT